MATIYFNDKLRRNLNQALFTRQYLSTPIENFQYGFYNSGISGFNYGTITLMKGTVPADFTSLVNSTSRASDVLVTWTTSQSGFTFNNPVTNDDGIAQIDSPYSVASASGIATWFWWYITTNTTTILAQLCGTVGTVGTDMIIADTTIIAGANYRFQNLKFDIPTEYTY